MGRVTRTWMWFWVGGGWVCLRVCSLFRLSRSAVSAERGPEEPTSPCAQRVGEGATAISDSAQALTSITLHGQLTKCVFAPLPQSIHPLTSLHSDPLQHLWSGCLTRSHRRPPGLWSGPRSRRRLSALGQSQAVRIPDQTRATAGPGHGDDGGRRYGQAGGHVIGVRLRPDHGEHPRHQSRNHRLLQVRPGSASGKFGVKDRRKESCGCACIFNWNLIRNVRYKDRAAGFGCGQWEWLF